MCSTKVLFLHIMYMLCTKTKQNFFKSLLRNENNSGKYTFEGIHEFRI